MLFKEVKTWKKLYGYELLIENTGEKKAGENFRKVV